jgi:hypothetical protein
VITSLTHKPLVVATRQRAVASGQMRPIQGGSDRWPAGYLDSRPVARVPEAGPNDSEAALDSLAR